MLDDILVERRARGHQHGRRRALPPSGTAGPLPGGRNRARVAGHHHRIERPDVDPQLERIGGRDGPDLAIPKPALDLPAFARQVTATIPAHAFTRCWPALKSV